MRLIFTLLEDGYYHGRDLKWRSDLNNTDSLQFPPQSTALRATSNKRITQGNRWPGFMSLTTVAAYLDMSVGTLRKLIEQGALPAPSFDPSQRSKRWSRHEIDEHFNSDQSGSVGVVTMADIFKHSKNPNSVGMQNG